MIFRIANNDAGYYITTDGTQFLLRDGRLIDGWDAGYHDHAYWPTKDEAQEFYNNWKKPTMDPTEDVFLTLTNDCPSYKLILKWVRLRQRMEISWHDLTDRCHRRACSYYRAVRQPLPDFNPELLSEQLYNYYLPEVDTGSPEKSPAVLQQEIIDHLENATESFKKVQLNLPKEEYTMIEIKDVTYVNGTDVATMTDDQVFSAIAKAEGEISKLKEIKTKSKKLTAKIADMQKGIDDLVAIIDAR